MELLRNPKFWYVAAVIWAIIAAIGFAMLLLSVQSPRLSSFAEIFSIIGAIGSWLSVLTGATIWGQGEILRRQSEALALLREMRDLMKKRTRILAR